MSTKANEDGVHRLLDIVVEEVSLVDRAANQRRFLVVKRSEEMDESTQAQGGETTPNDTPPTPEVEDLNATPEEPEGDTQPEAPPAGSPLAVAVDALGELTGAVERLESLADDDARTELTRVAAELRAAADHIAPASTTAADSPGGDLADILASVRETVARIREAVAPKPADEPAETPPETPPATDETAAALARVAEQLSALAATVQEQQARLSRIEKRFGLPNSASAGERVTKTEDEDTGWPLDLNRRMDRASVDKSVSFHEL